MTRRPASLIPASRYVSPDWAARENAFLWPRIWHFACLSSDIALPGERSVLDIGSTSAFVIRGEDGIARGFHNVCRHRGSRLCNSSDSSSAHVRCPYHHWTWQPTGKLLSMPEGTQFLQPPGDVALLPVLCEERHGLVWLCLDTPRVPLDEFLAPIEQILQVFRLDRWTRTDAITLDVQANWKTSADVSNEGYHLRTLHPEVLPVLDDTQTQLDFLGPHSQLIAHFGQPSPHMAANAPYDETVKGWLQSLGLTQPLDPRTPHLRGRVQQAMRAHGLAQKLPWNLLTDAQLIDNTQLNLFPNTQLNLYAHRLQVYRHRPGLTPVLMEFDQFGYRPLAEGETRPPLPPHKHGDARTAEQGPMMAADLAIVANLQRGLQSPACDGLRLTREEGAIAHLHAGLEEWLETP